MAKRSTVGGDGWRHVPVGNTGGRTVALLGSAVDIGAVGGAVLCRWRGRAIVDRLRDGGLLCEEVGQLGGDTGVVVGHVLARQRDGRLVKVLGQGKQCVARITVPLAIADLGSAEDGSCQGVGSPGHGRRLGGHKVAVVEGDLTNVSGHVSNFAVVLLVGPNDGLEEVDRGVANVPLEGIEDVHLHLGEHAGIVQTTAHIVQLVDLGNTVLLVAVLGSNQQRCAADKLVVLLIDDPLGAVSVKQVDGQEHGFPQEGECRVCLDQEVNQVRPHEPLDLALHVDEVGVGKSFVLCGITSSVIYLSQEILIQGKSGDPPPLPEHAA